MDRKKKQEPRRQEIVKAFYRLARKEGLENASIAKTADLIGINPSLVMYYFKTRDELIYELVEYTLERYLLIFKKTDKGASPKEKLLGVVDDIFSQKWNALFDDGVFYSCYALIFRDKAVKKKYEKLLNTLRKNLETLIIECKNNGDLKIADPAVIADLIFMLVDGAYFYLSTVSDPKMGSVKLDTYKKRALFLLGLTGQVTVPEN